MGSSFKQRGSTSVKMDKQQLSQEFCANLGSKHGHSGRATGNLRRTYEEQRRTAKNSGTLMWIYGGEVQGLTGAELRWRSVAFLWSRQDDAAA